MPRGHEQLQEPSLDLEFPDDSEYEACGLNAMHWAAPEAAAVLVYVTHISESALSRIHSLTMRYRKDSSGVTGTRYFMNHWEHCDAKLGDFETIEEFDAPLHPIGTESASRLVRYPMNEPLEADSSSTPLSAEYLDHG
jgi:hypothetical protein